MSTFLRFKPHTGHLPENRQAGHQQQVGKPAARPEHPALASGCARRGWCESSAVQPLCWATLHDRVSEGNCALLSHCTWHKSLHAISAHSWCPYVWYTKSAVPSHHIPTSSSPTFLWAMDSGPSTPLQDGYSPLWPGATRRD